MKESYQNEMFDYLDKMGIENFVGVPDSILKKLKSIKNNMGPIMIIVKIKKGGSAGNRISTSPNKIKEQFINNL